MKRILRRLIPLAHVDNSSQTLYQALLGSINMYEASQDVYWKLRSDYIKDRLLDIQQDDGGFDIGYNFNFGYKHKKGESTSPELVAVIALCRYAEVFDKKDELRNSIEKAISWIVKFSTKVSTDEWAIPYGPYSTSDIVVYNGTSFACSALGVYIGIYGNANEKVCQIYKGMILYLYRVLSSSDGHDGLFWYYNVENNSKIDYYHQMQQVEFHSLANKYCYDEIQSKLIVKASRFVLQISEDKDIIPYTNNGSFGNRIHLWGYCSVLSGFCYSKDLDIENKQRYEKAIDEILNNIIQNSWNGTFFFPILNKDLSVYEDRFFVRSDAWVFNSLSLYYKVMLKSPVLKDVIKKSFNTILASNFCGLENHAANNSRKLVLNLLQICIRIRKLF